MSIIQWLACWRGVCLAKANAHLSEVTAMRPSCAELSTALIRGLTALPLLFVLALLPGRSGLDSGIAPHPGHSLPRPDAAGSGCRDRTSVLLAVRMPADLPPRLRPAPQGCRI